MEPKRKNFGPVEMLTLLVIVGILGFVLIKYGGCNMVERTEDTKFIDPNKTSEIKPLPQTAPSATESQVDQMLRDFASDLSHSSPDLETSTRRWGLDDEEAAYYEEIQDKYQVGEKIKSAAEWLAILRKSQKTYSAVKELWDSANGENASTTRPANTEDFYSGLKKNFNLSNEEILDFVAKGSQSLKDWATYLEEKQQ